jgi:hypothetical protein
VQFGVVQLSVFSAKRIKLFSKFETEKETSLSTMANRRLEVRVIPRSIITEPSFTLTFGVIK